MNGEVNCSVHWRNATQSEKATDQTTKSSRPDRLVSALAHRACHSAEHNPKEGRLHGYCIICGVPWPCETAKQFAVKEPAPQPEIEKLVGDMRYKWQIGKDVVFGSGSVRDIQILCDALQRATAGLRGEHISKCVDMGVHINNLKSELSASSDATLSERREKEGFKELCSTLRTQLDTTQKDSERLDWLESVQRGENDLDLCLRSEGYFISHIFNQERDCPPQRRFRDAIDAAMLKQP